MTRRHGDCNVCATSKGDAHRLQVCQHLIDIALHTGQVSELGLNLWGEVLFIDSHRPCARGQPPLEVILGGIDGEPVAVAHTSPWPYLARPHMGR